MISRTAFAALLLVATSLSPAARGQEIASPVACETLGGISIPASMIGMPTSGATVTSATTIPASGQGAAAIGEYCKVLVAIHPVDPSAPDITVQVNLPAAWNGKAVMFGGGGFDGVMPRTAVNYFNGPAGKPIPLGEGYVTFGGNAGHVAGPLAVRDGSFARNREALHNYAGDAVKKTRDIAMHLVQARYGRPPSRSYFIGGSGGGRAALWAVQNTPQDFDGVVAMYPAWNMGVGMLQAGRITRALAQPGAYLDLPKQLVWMKAVIAACDELDGLADGIVSNVRACRFDPSTATVADGSAPLRCPGGGPGDGCVSDEQIAALRVYATPIFVPYRTGSGEFFYPGYNVFAGADITGVRGMNLQQPTSAIITAGPDACAPAFRVCAAYNRMPFISAYWDQFVKHFVTGDPAYDSLAVDPRHPGMHEERISDAIGLLDVKGTDLSAFQGAGGKLILMHGLADEIVPVDATTEYYLRLVLDMGWSEVRSFVRYYTIAGLGHGLGSPSAIGGGFTAAWDPLEALDAWVETGKPPQGIVATDPSTATGRTRPVCEFPTWPRYRGTGDPNAATSFTCAVW